MQNNKSFGGVNIIRLESIFYRLDEVAFEEILGSQTIRILKILNNNFISTKKLRELISEAFSPEIFLLEKKYRAVIIDLLKLEEAELLGKLLNISSSSTTDLYEKLKQRTVVRGSKLEEKLFRFFNLYVPPTETVIDVPSRFTTEGKYQLFIHQRNVSRKVKLHLENEPYRVLLHMPTGAGKTRTAMNIIADHLRVNEPTVVIWLATSEELCEQATSEFDKAWNYLGNRKLDIHRFWGNHSLNLKDIKDGFVVAGLPKMVSAISKGDGIDFISKLANKCSLVIMDEAHQAIAPTYSRVLNALFYIGQNKNKALLGLSATPGRTWNDIDADKELAIYFNKRKVTLKVDGYINPVDYLVDKGYLAKAEYKQLIHNSESITENEIGTVVESNDIPKKVLNKLGQDEQRNIKIIQAAEDLLSRHKRIILFAPSVESSNLISFVLRSKGHHAVSLTGMSSDLQRKKIIDDFKSENEQPIILCNYGVLTTGFDAPKTSAAIIGRPTISLVLYSQMVGRAIRGHLAGGNANAEIVTIVDNNLPGFKNVSEAFENWDDVWD